MRERYAECSTLLMSSHVNVCPEVDSCRRCKDRLHRTRLAVGERIRLGGAKLRLDESFNARLRDELLNGELFYTLTEARIIIESWRRHYNSVRPHSPLGYKPPAPEVFVPTHAAWPSPLVKAAPTAPLALALRPPLH